MEKIQLFFKDNPYMWYYVGLVVLSIVFIVFSQMRVRKKKNEFLDLNPNAARILLNRQGFVSSVTIHIHEVNGEAVNADMKSFYGTSTESQFFQDKTKYGIFVKPGENKLSVSYEHTRPGVMHKSVTEYTDPVQVIVNCKANATYKLSYDKDTNLYGVEEID
ncbi:MAG: hypothetical protein RR565_03275 [Erysipelothrix sp.]